MDKIKVDVVSFEDFLIEDAKSISDANHHNKNGDQTADKLKEPAEHKIDKNGIETDGNQGKANKLSNGDKTAEKLKEDVEKVGTKEDQIDKDDGDDDGDDDKKSDKKAPPFVKKDDEKKSDKDEEEEEGDDD